MLCGASSLRLFVPWCQASFARNTDWRRRWRTRMCSSTIANLILEVLKDVGAADWSARGAFRGVGGSVQSYEEEVRKPWIEVIDVEMPTLNAATEMTTGISFNDSLCFLVCLAHGWACVTNDRALGRLCCCRDVKVRYGLGLRLEGTADVGRR